MEASSSGDAIPRSRGTNAAFRSTVQCGMSPPPLLHVPDGAAQLHRVHCADVPPPDAYLPGVGRDHPVEQAEQCGFSGAAFTDECDDIPSFEG